MDIKEKEKIFEASCKKMLANDVTELNRNIDNDIDKQIKDELQEYENKEKFIYNKKLEKLEKEYNKQIFAMELDAKKEVLLEKKNIRKNLKKEIENILRDYTKKQEYKKLLFSRIEEMLKKVGVNESLILGVVAQDNQRFGKEIQTMYNVNLNIIEDDFIGGCILEDKLNGIYLDYTLQNSINEELELR